MSGWRICAMGWLAGVLQLAAALPCAAAQDAQAEAPMVAPSPTPAAGSEGSSDDNGNGVTAEELGERFLRFTRSLEPDDVLSLEQVEAAFGLKLAITPQGNAYGAYGALVGGWRYQLRYRKGEPSYPPFFRLSFYPGKDVSRPRSVICGLDFNHYDAALKEMGFSEYANYGEHRQLIEWVYTKFSSSTGRVGMSVIIGPLSVGRTDPGRTCVESISTVVGER